MYRKKKNRSNKIRRRKENVDLMKIFLNASPQRRRVLLEDGELLKFIIDCCTNFLRGNIRTVNHRVLSQLSRHKNLIRLLANRRTSKSRKKKIVAKGIQTGGFLQLLLPFAVRLLSGLARGLTGSQ